MMSNTVYHTLKDLQPCVFKIKDTVYYIGCSVFRKCTDSEIFEYNEYCKYFEYIRKKQKRICVKSQSIALKELFSKLMYRKDFEYTAIDCQKFSHKLLDFLSELSEEELEDILKQENNIKSAYKHCERGDDL